MNLLFIFADGKAVGSTKIPSFFVDVINEWPLNKNLRSLHSIKIQNDIKLANENL